MNKNISRVFGIMILLVLIFSIANTACQNNDNVTYEVTGDAESVDIMVTNDNGCTEQYNDVPSPWQMDYGGSDRKQMKLSGAGDPGKSETVMTTSGNLQYFYKSNFKRQVFTG